jgi:hypothetical protein
VHAMAASLGLNPEAVFTSYTSSPPFMSDYVAASFLPPAVVDSTDFSAELDDLHHHLDYSSPAPTLAGARSDRSEKQMMYVLPMHSKFYQINCYGVASYYWLLFLLLTVVYCYGDFISSISRWCEGGGGEKRLGRIGFRTRSEVEILDDGFKWRKYGKKAVKSSPNPRYTHMFTWNIVKINSQNMKATSRKATKKK